MDPPHTQSDSLKRSNSPGKTQPDDSSLSSTKHKPNCLQMAGSFLSGPLERFYYFVGLNIAKRPKITIACVLLAYLVCLSGLVRFYEVDATEPIWVDPKSEYMRDRTWVLDNFPSQIRINFLIADADDNILNPTAMLQVYDLHQQAIDLPNYEKVCAKLGRGSNAECWTNSILELWDFNRTVISTLTTQDIIFAVNNITVSPATDGPIDVTTLLGEIERDSSNKIISAKAAILTYYLKSSNSTDDVAVEDQVTDMAQAWELEFVYVAGNYSTSVIKRARVFASRSFGDEIGSSILGDVAMLSAGYFLIIIYVSLVLGRFNCVEQRVWLGIACVLGVGLSIGLSFGLSSGFGIPYGPVQSILPFLLLGLGVDDGFVIVQAWNRLTPDERKLPLVEQAGHALRHAGVSITVTSITDMVAFGIGATTVLPALRDFCIYATIGIIGVFIIQATFFSACVVLDEQRRRVYRNACCCCYTHPEPYEPNECSKRDIQQSVFENYYAPTIMKLPVKIVVVIISLALLALGLYGVVFLKQEYDPNSFIPSDSYLKEYVNTYEQKFPDLGVDSADVYFKQLNYFDETDRIEEMMDELKALSQIDTETVDPWVTGYREWLSQTKCPWVKSHLNTTTKWPLDSTKFVMLLSPYLYMTENGQRHLRNVKFDSDLNVTLSEDDQNLFTNGLNSTEVLDLEDEFSARSLLASRMPFSYGRLAGSAEGVQAMDDTRAIVVKYYTVEQAFAYSRSYENWETDKIIQNELYRNIGLAFGCVIVLTLLLIADLGACALVSVSVLSTLVEVGGFMYFWNLTIDTVTCIQLVLAIGLAVDYSAHIGHTYMTVTGTRNERALKTLADIGPAVFNGGFSTLLAFLLLASSNSYVFDVFFRVNLLVVLIGLWNGMVFLPVMLSWIGPPPYLSALIRDKVGPFDDKEVLKRNDSAHNNPAFVSPKDEESMVSGTFGFKSQEAASMPNGSATNDAADNTQTNGTALSQTNTATPGTSTSSLHENSENNEKLTTVD